jgi:hypothetical protein
MIFSRLCPKTAYFANFEQNFNEIFFTGCYIYMQCSHVRNWPYYIPATFRLICFTNLANQRYPMCIIPYEEVAPKRLLLELCCCRFWCLDSTVCFKTFVQNWLQYVILEMVGPNENDHATPASTFWYGGWNFILEEGAVFFFWRRVLYIPSGQCFSDWPDEWLQILPHPWLCDVLFLGHYSQLLQISNNQKAPESWRLI